MTDEPLTTDDQSHYEVSLTAGQAFLAFVLLLLSLAASFAFGLVIGRGQNSDKLLAAKDTPVVSEANVVAAKKTTPAAEVAVKEDDFKPSEIKEEAPVTASQPPAKPAAEIAQPKVAPAPAPMPAVPHTAQLLSTSDQKTAETLAAKLIDGGFTSAYVERGTSAKGTVYRVRVKFPSEEEAKSAEPKLKTFSKDVWITKG